MTADALATSFTLRLPEWLERELPRLPEILPDVDGRMALVNRLARRNFAEGNGGPFAALVVERETGRLVSVGVNVVLSTGISSGHAEVVALGMAQQRVGGWDLAAAHLPEHELIVNWRPCVQCYGATMWSGVTSLVVAGSGPELEELSGFDEGPMREDWDEQFRRRGISVVSGVRRDEALDVYREYGAWVAAHDGVVYNARASRPE